jgi:hypothetical protein
MTRFRNNQISHRWHCLRDFEREGLQKSSPLATVRKTKLALTLCSDLGRDHWVIGGVKGHNHGIWSQPSGFKSWSTIYFYKTLDMVLNPFMPQFPHIIHIPHRDIGRIQWMKIDRNRKRPLRTVVGSNDDWKAICPKASQLPSQLGQNNSVIIWRALALRILH